MIAGETVSLEEVLDELPASMRPFVRKVSSRLLVHRVHWIQCTHGRRLTEAGLVALQCALGGYGETSLVIVLNALHARISGRLA